MKSYYDKPIKCPAFGLLDHYFVEVQPKERPKSSQVKHTVFFQRSKTQQSSGNAEVQMDVTDIIHTASSCEDKTSLLLKIVKTGIDAISPLQSKFIHITEPPWINSSLKSLIRKRQSALNQGDLKEFHHLRNRVNPERKICRAKYYEWKVEHLKESSSSSWWKEVKKLSGVSKPGSED